MAVFLSPVGGAAVQFFDNSGNVLTGGKLYTYLAGTTTPTATYTSNTGTTFHSNPIILDAAGRVSNGGEIWLADNIQYKFVLKDANDVLIGTYDNLTGVNSNFLNYNVQEEIVAATAGQTIFNLSTITYAPGTNTLSVFVDGVNQYDGITYSYIETGPNTVTFTEGLHVGALVKFSTAVTLSAGVSSANLVTYDPPFVGGVLTTVQNKLAQYVSVKDFGAVGDGVTDDTNAFNAMFATGSNSFQLIAGEQYLIGDVVLPTGSGWELNGNWATLIPKAGAATCLSGAYTTQIFNTAIRNLNISGDVTDVIKFTLTGNGVLLNCEIDGITATNGTCTTLITINSNATGQGETLRFTNLSIFGADYNHVVYLYGGSSNYGSCEFKNIFHNANVGVATIYAVDGLFLASFDLIYHTRGTGVKVGAGKTIVHSTFSRMETESVEHNTVLYAGDFDNCSFDVSTVYNQALAAPWTEQIASGVFTNCNFSNNFVFQTSGTTITFAAGSTRNTVNDLKIGAITYVDYTTISDAGTFNNFVGEQYTSPNTACTDAITSGAIYTLVKNGQMISLDLPAVSGLAAANTSFSFGAVLPAKYRPATVDTSVSAFIIDAGGTSAVPGLIKIATNGTISVFKSADETSTYTAGTIAGLAGSVTISWIL